jgi:hypothetical protein
MIACCISQHPKIGNRVDQHRKDEEYIHVDDRNEEKIVSTVELCITRI